MPGKKIVLKAVFRGVDKMSGSVKRMQRGFKRFTASARRGLKRVARGAKAVGKAMKVATVAMLGLGAAAYKVTQIGAAFEKSLVSAAVKFPGKIRKGSEAFEELEKAARKTGASTEFTASQSAKALESYAMAGFNANQAIASLSATVNLATSAGLELEESSNVVTKSLGAFGLVTKDSTQLAKNLARVADTLAATSTSAATDVAGLFEAISAGGAVVNDAGGDIETFAALAGKMAIANQEGEKAGTALRNMFLRIQAPAGAAKRMIKKYAGDISDADGNMIDFVEIIGRMEKSMKGMGGIRRAQIMDTVFGKKAIVAANVVFGAGAKEIGRYREEIRAATGSSAEMAGEIRDTTSGSIDTLKSTLEAVVIELFKMNKGGIRDTIESTTEWIRKNKELIGSNLGGFFRGMIKAIKAIAKGLSFVSDNFQTIVNVLRIGLPILIGFKTALFLMTAAETLRGLAGLSSGISGIGTKATGTLGVVGKLSGAIGVLAAGVVGWQIGSILHEQVLGPLANSRAELKRLLDETESRMGRAMKRGKVADVQNEVNRTQERVQKFASGVSMEDVVGFFASPTEFFTNRLKTIIKASGDIKKGKAFVSKEVAIQNDVLRESSSPVVKEYLRTGITPENAPDVVSPTESLSRSIDEKIEKSKTEITVKAAPGTSAEITSQKGTSSGLTLQTSGGI